MPRLKANLRSRYPAVDRLLKGLASRVKGKRRVLQAYQKHTGMDRTSALMSLQPSGVVLASSPNSVVPQPRKIPEVRLSRTISGYAKYPGIGDVIRLRKLFAEQYEALIRSDPIGKDPHGRTLEERAHPVRVGTDRHGGPLIERGAGVLTNEQKKARMLMESKVLHEMVHWARTMVTLLPDPDSGPNEQGWKFEMAAYGRELTALELGIRQYILIPGNK